MAIAAAVAWAAARPAAAQPDRYFESRGFQPEGVVFGLLTQGGGFVSTSCCEIGGRRGGGGGGIRIGTAAGDALLWIVQIEGAAVPVRDAAGKVKINRHGTLTLGAQWYARRTLWLHGGAGVATYEIAEAVEQTEIRDLQRTGVAVTGAVGFDFFRMVDVRPAWLLAQQDFAFSFEVRVVGALYPGGAGDVGQPRQKTGAIGQFTMGLGFSWY
ncbi:MAG: hypothetical protein D6689_13345 [Deltaproteobacteria bacterium]|nr:MAG: hypothetical protein D6689_13345 [Deltaproteobacteria bacterium]